jgi:hypothetical protein
VLVCARKRETGRQARTWSGWERPVGQAGAHTSPSTHRVAVSAEGDAHDFTVEDQPAAWLKSSKADASRGVPAHSTCRSGQMGCRTVSHSCSVATIVWRVIKEGVTFKGRCSNDCTLHLICQSAARFLQPL